MRAYRPSQFADPLEPVDLSMDPERLRRVVVYCRRAENGQPLFEDSVPVRVKHARQRFPKTKAG